MTYGYDPCNPCCCKLGSDDFDDATITGWTQDAGSWSEGSSVLSTSSTSAAISFDSAGALEQRVSCTVTPNGNGDKARLMLDYQDEDNYLAGEFEFHATDGYVRLISRSSGSDTILQEKFVGGSDLAINATGLAVCLRDGVLTASAGLGANTEVDDNGGSGHTATSGKVALGTGDSLSGQMDFDAFQFNRVDPGCEQCLVPCDKCEDGVAGPYQVDIDAVANQVCSSCDAFNASYVYYPDNVGSSPAARCRDRRTVSDCSGNIFVDLNIENDSPSGIRLRLDVIEGTGGATFTANVSADSNYNCTSQERIQLNFVSDNGPQCDWTNAEVFAQNL